MFVEWILNTLTHAHKGHTAGTLPLTGLALQEVRVLFGWFSELSAAMKICLCSTHFTHYSMNNFAIKTKSWDSSFPKERTNSSPSLSIFRTCPKYPLIVSHPTWKWLFILLIKGICQVRGLRLFVTLEQLMKPWSEASASCTWGQISCRSPVAHGHGGSSVFKIWRWHHCLKY